MIQAHDVDHNVFGMVDRQLLVAPIVAATTFAIMAESAQSREGGIFSPTRSSELAKK